MRWLIKPVLYIITARIRRMGEGTVFSLFVSPHLGGGGTPVRSGGGYPIPGLVGVPPGPGMGYPLPDLGQGTPPGPGTGYLPWTWDRVPPGPGTGDRVPPSIASTCYAAGGMPLAFTQEDFLVILLFSTLQLVLSLGTADVPV